jgi:hypothetical protein
MQRLLALIGIGVDRKGWIAIFPSHLLFSRRVREPLPRCEPTRGPGKSQTGAFALNAAGVGRLFWVMSRVISVANGGGMRTGWPQRVRKVFEPVVVTSSAVSRTIREGIWP